LLAPLFASFELQQQALLVLLPVFSEFQQQLFPLQLSFLQVVFLLRA